jgi:hypothetical protein
VVLERSFEDELAYVAQLDQLSVVAQLRREKLVSLAAGTPS